MAKRKVAQDEADCICPGCGKKCLYLKIWPTDFLAVHKIDRIKVKGKSVDYEISKFSNGCDKNGKLPRGI